MTPEQRTAIYTTVPVLASVLVVFGVLDENQASSVGAAVLAILGVLVAFYNRPTKV